MVHEGLAARQQHEGAAAGPSLEDLRRAEFS
jgi:hypothetical protein